MQSIFEKAGKTNTKEVLAVLKEGITRHGVNQVVVASTYGDTGRAAAELLRDSGVRLVVVTHNVGFKEPGVIEMTDETRKAIEVCGAMVYTGTMPFRSICSAIREKQCGSQQDIVANTLRLFGQGMKVCVEIVMMAADAGLVGPSDVIAVAGTARGADTVALIAPQSSNRLFDLKVRQVLAKPVDW